MEVSNQINHILSEANKVVLGKEKEVKLALCSILCNGHLLLEDIPGVGKTTLVQLLANLSGLALSRIQFTNDLLPSDIIGTSVFLQNQNEFQFKKGPLFGEMILADELNRATPKTQSALLQAMEERSINIDGQFFELGERFLIVATQNPHQQIGTFPLPESQLDRFFMSLHLGFPEREFERQIIFNGGMRDQIKALDFSLGSEDLLKIRKQISNVFLSEEVENYILDLLTVGRNEIESGVLLSPRSGIDLVMASKSYALVHNRDHVLLEDIQTVAPYIWGHRLGGSMGIAFGHQKVKELIASVTVNA